MVKKKVLSILLTVTLIISFSYSVIANNTVDEVTIKLLATSDIHNKFYPYEYAVNEESKNGSLTQLATVVNTLRDENTILIDAGDTMQGNNSELFLKDDIIPMMAGMNAMNYDIWTLGNHEFNYGVNLLEKVMKTSKAKILCGNVYNPDGSRLADSYTIIEKNGVKIGLIGMVTPNITKWDSEKLEGYKVTDPLEELNKAIEEIKDKVDVIVSVNHMSENNEYGVKNSGVDDLANASKDVDVIIAGHGHQEVNKVLNNIPIVENKADGTTIAEVNIKLKKGTNGKFEIIDKQTNIIDVSKYEPDEKMLKTLETYHKRAKYDADTVIGKLEGGNLIPDSEVQGISEAFLRDTAFVDLINEVQMYYTDADVSAASIFNANANLYEGEIKKSDASLIYKYSNTLYLFEMTGKQLKQYMEWSASYYNQYKDGDLTVSFDPESRAFLYDMFAGVNYEVDISEPIGSRIKKLTKKDGTPVKDTDVFKVATNNYRANTQILADEIFKEGEKPKLLEVDVRGDLGGVRELIVDYIKNVKKGVITPKVDNNWQLVGTNWDKALRQKAVEQINSGQIKLEKYNSKSITVNDLKDAKNTISSNVENVGVKIVKKRMKIAS